MPATSCEDSRDARFALRWVDVLEGVLTAIGSTCFPQLPRPQGVQPKAWFGCADQYSRDDVAHQGEPALGLGSLRRGLLNLVQA